MNPAPLLTVLAFGAVANAADLFPFVLPWDDASESATNVSWLNDKPAGRDGFVHVKDGHLFAGEKRLRIFGVNTCFAANFPDKDMAPKIAARMAKFGINCVRFHHMDMFSAPGGIFAKDVDNYCAAMIALQKDYARDLLTHVNAYTGNRYADEPAVALVEINNENALGFQWWAGQMDDLPAPYREELESLWGAWILKRHGSDEKARAVWSVGAREAGGELLTEPKWFFEQHGGAAANHSEKDGIITLNVTKPGTETWHVQFSASPLAVKAGSYEVRFRVRAPKDASLSVALMQSHEPWKVLGSANMKPGNSGAHAGDGWREVSATIQADADDDKARLTIGGMGTAIGTFEFSGISLRTAGVDGSLKRVSFLSDEPYPALRVRIVRKTDLARTTAAKQRNWQEFIWDTETAYWNGMRDFLKKELGVKAPIVGTQGAWSPGHVQAGMDVIDSHAYWHHPDFHGKGWNADVWSVKNEPMAGAPDGGTLPGLAAQRVAGKPFICTEYNHPAPNTYSAETFPLLCAFAALQDWDGVFAFSYSHRAGDAWSQEHFDNFFDIDRHPVKMATLPGAVVLWRRGEKVAAIREHLYWGGNQKDALLAASYGPSFAATVTKPYWQSAETFLSRVASVVKLDAPTPFPAWPGEWDQRKPPADSRPERYSGPKRKEPESWMNKNYVADGRSSWSWNSDTRLATIETPQSAFFIGRGETARSMTIGKTTLASGPTRQDWFCYQLTVLDRDERADFSTAKRILITATGDIENTGMGWKNAEKTGVGRDWGKAPVLVEGPAAKIELPGGGKFKAWALDERGQRRAEIPVTNGTLEIGPQHRTLWYEVERQP